MSKINAATFCAGLLTILVLLAMGHFPLVPLWALFIAWACFFHMGGGEAPKATFITAGVHIGVGAISAWLSALLLFANPFSGAIADQLWPALVIGGAIALLVRMSLVSWLMATPAIIYGYASVWAYLSLPGRFDLTVLQSLSFDNAVIAIVVTAFLGICMGYVNARLVQRLTRIAQLAEGSRR